MNDGSGSTSYQYDQLSRMASETKTINGLGSYSIGYTYNLAGELKTLTDPDGRVVNYDYDSVGHLNNVTGVGFNTSSFISNYQYRAWGAPKHFNSPALPYNTISSLDFSYNSRLQLTHFEYETPYASGTIDGSRSDYQYYADGQIKFISDARRWSNSEEGYHNFDRSYNYDHAARLTQALTGNEARGGSTADGPYNETYQYDALNHMTNRMNRIWSKPPDGFTHAYVNNRIQEWPAQYDADGNDLSDGTYDAAGRKATFGSYLLLSLGSVGNL